MIALNKKSSSECIKFPLELIRCHLKHTSSTGSQTLNHLWEFPIDIWCCVPVDQPNHFLFSGPVGQYSSTVLYKSSFCTQKNCAQCICVELKSVSIVLRWKGVYFLSFVKTTSTGTKDGLREMPCGPVCCHDCFMYLQQSISRQ